jgi:DNA-binding transcriptional LysR family regulator
MALIAWPCVEPPGVALEQLLTLRERVVLVAAPEHRLAQQGTVDAAQLAALAQPLLLLRWWTTLPPGLARFAEQARPQLDVPMDTGRQLVLSGVGAGFFPWMQVATALNVGRLREVAVRDMPPLVRESALVRRQDTPLTVAATALVAALCERAAQLGILKERYRSSK